MIDWKVGEMEKAKALASLQKCKEFLDPFLKGKEDIESMFDEIDEALEERHDLPIYVFGGGIEIHIEIGKYDHLYYETEYNIDDDIAELMAMETYDDRIHMSHEEYNEIQHAISLLFDFAGYLGAVDNSDATYGLGLIENVLNRVVITEEVEV
jgi:hypothetical protein